MNVCVRRRLRFYRRVCGSGARATGALVYALVGAQDFPWTRHPAASLFETYRERFRDGHRAYIGDAGGEIAFTAWVAEKSLRVDECAWRWTIAATDAVVYDCVTAEQWRGRGIYPEALRELAQLLAADGRRHLWIYADAMNAASLRGIEKAEFEFRGEIASCTFLGWTMRRGRVDGVNA